MTIKKMALKLILLFISGTCIFAADNTPLNEKFIDFKRVKTTSVDRTQVKTGPHSVLSWTVTASPERFKRKAGTS